MDIDDILPTIGAFGRFQKTQFALLCIPGGLMAAIIAFHSTFISGAPLHWCNVPDLGQYNLTVDQRKHLSIPRSKTDPNLYDSCEMYDVDFDKYMQSGSEAWPPEPLPTWGTKKCDHGWEYDRSIYEDNLVIKFDLVCVKDWLPPLSKSMFYMGSFVGNFILGFISDRFGRRNALLVTVLWMITFTVATVATVNFPMYIFFRFLTGFSFPSIYQIPFIAAIELMAPDKRTFVGNIIATVFALGLALLALMGYFLRNWIHLTLASSLPFLVLVAYYWLVPESTRWLLSQKRFDEAEAILQKIAETNGRKLPLDFIEKLTESQESKEEPERPVFWDLFKTPNMRKKMLIIMFCWPINAVVYTVLSFQASALGVNEYLGFAISGLVEIPSYFFIWWLMDIIGRRWSIFVTMLIGGIACIVTMFLPTTMVWATIILAMVGKCGIAASFSVIYVFAGELYPTTVRSSAIGTFASTAGIALIACPYLMYLSKFGKSIPLVICGVLSVLGAISVIFLPETLYYPLPQTMNEGEQFGKNFKLLTFPKKRRRVSMNLSIRRFSGPPAENEMEMEKKEREGMLNGRADVQMLSNV